MSSRIRINRLPLRNAARAIRAVSSGTGSIGDGRIDIASLLQGVPRLNTPISPNDQQYQAWGIWPLTIHAAGWGIMVNMTVAVLVSLVTRDDRARKMEFHTVLRKYAALPAKRRRLAPLAWILAILWLVFAFGPGAVIGNTLFGDPNDPSGWLF